MKTFFFISMVLLALNAYSQVTITGTVKDQSGEALTGALVLEVGTLNAVLVDEEGNFEITVLGVGSDLQARLVGYSTQNVLVGTNTTIHFVLEPANILNTVIIVGSRSLMRSKTTTPLPVDVIEVRDVTNLQGQFDLQQALQFLIPSLNSNRQSGADGSDHVEPFSLRGLGPDQVLVLINGKRRHQSSLVNLYGSRGRGNTGTDLNAIPASAIERIEILRDGAAAQYGSDAIAGVINIILKETLGFTGGVNIGAHEARSNPNRPLLDGENAQISANYGLRIGVNGIMNVTTDFNFWGHTRRFEDPGLYRRMFGDTEGSNFNLTFNAKLPITNQANLYAFGGNNYRETDAYAWSRFPFTPRNVEAIYPNAFDPIISTEITDRSITGGVKGIVGKWGADISFTNGYNNMHYFVKNSLNASLEHKSPTEFDAGGFKQRVITTNLDFTRFFKEWFAGTNVAFGFEHRTENYEIFAGEEASYKTYGPIIYRIDSQFVDGVFIKLDTTYRPGGSQGFPGFSPANEVRAGRSSFGTYGDIEVDVNKKTTLAAALRAERYSDFGFTLNGKLAGKYRINEFVIVRGSASSGFRAPSLAQLYFNSVFTDFVQGVPIDKYLAPSNSVITRTLGVPRLKQETSANFGAGVTFTFENFTATFDAYRIRVRDRIVLTGDFTADDPDIGSELRLLNVGTVRFFSNALNTNSNGQDVVLTYFVPLKKDARITAIVAANFNNMSIEKINTPSRLKGKEEFFLSNREKLFILASAPPMKTHANIQYKTNRYSINLRGTYFEKIELEDYVGNIDVYDPRMVLDLNAAYEIDSKVSLVVGINNLFNAYPTRQDVETESGGLYDAVQMGFNGRFYYTRLGFRF